YAARGRPPHLSERQFARLMASGKHLWDHMADAPVILVPCSHRPVLPAREALPPDIAALWDEEAAYAERIRGASIYPAVQNILLACRGFGSRHCRQDQPHPLRGRGQETAWHSRGGLDVGADAGWLADRQVRAADAPAAYRSRPRRTLGRRVAGRLRKTEASAGDRSCTELPQPRDTLRL